MQIFNVVVLLLSGLLLTYAGSMRLFKPIKSFCLKMYLDDPAIKLKAKVDVFNEMRGAGSSIVLGGVVVILGAIIPELMLTGFIVAIVIFIGHAIGRLVSLKFDGKPNAQLAQGLGSELVLGAANIFCLVFSLV